MPNFSYIVSGRLSNVGRRTFFLSHHLLGQMLSWLELNGHHFLAVSISTFFHHEEQQFVLWIFCLGYFLIAFLDEYAKPLCKELYRKNVMQTFLLEMVSYFRVPMLGELQEHFCLLFLRLELLRTGTWGSFLDQYVRQSIASMCQFSSLFSKNVFVDQHLHRLASCDNYITIMGVM